MAVCVLACAYRYLYNLKWLKPKHCWATFAELQPGNVLHSMKVAVQQGIQAGSRGVGRRGGDPPAGAGHWPAMQALPHAAYPGALPIALPSDPTSSGSLPWSGPAPEGNLCCAGTVAKAAAEFGDACMSPSLLSRLQQLTNKYCDAYSMHNAHSY